MPLVINHRGELLRIRLLTAAGLVVTAAAATLVVVTPGTALADPCGDDGTTKLTDPSASWFDFTQAGLTADHNQPFAALYDSGTNGPADIPPGPRSNSDAFDDWGALFVGGNAVSDMYFSADNNGCVNETGGSGHVYPVVSLHGLQVQRKLYVHPASEVGGLPGVRILDLLTNSGPTPVTTSVQVGDNLSADDDGDVGSDSDTAVRSSSSADAVATVGDKWFVTSDHVNSSGTENSDPAIAFVVDGPGGLSPATAIQVGGGTDATPHDNVVWSRQLTIQPGETAALMSFVVLADVAVGPTQAATADALAASRAQALLTAAPAQLYQGMSPVEIAALRNWNDLEVKGALVAKRQKLGKKYFAQVTCPEEACSVSLSGTLRVGRKKFALKTAHVVAAGGVATKVKLKLRGKKALRQVLALLDAKPNLHNHLKVTFTGTVSDLTNTAQQPVTGVAKVVTKQNR